MTNEELCREIKLASDDLRNQKAQVKVNRSLEYISLNIKAQVFYFQGNIVNQFCNDFDNLINKTQSDITLEQYILWLSTSW